MLTFHWFGGAGATNAGIKAPVAKLSRAGRYDRGPTEGAGHGGGPGGASLALGRTGRHHRGQAEVSGEDHHAEEPPAVPGQPHGAGCVCEAAGTRGPRVRTRYGAPGHTHRSVCLNESRSRLVLSTVFTDIRIFAFILLVLNACLVL